MNTQETTIQKGKLYSLSAFGIPKRCRKEQHYFLKGPFVRDESITRELERDIIADLKTKMLSSMKTVKKAHIKKVKAELDGEIMTHFISFGADNVIWSSEAQGV